jgi:hypothetical protein
MMMANELPDDLVTLILLWLPVVSLLRFKCVCKSWYALITHQNFVRKHLLHNKNSNTHLLLKMINKTIDDYVVSTISYEELQISLTQPLPRPVNEPSRAELWQTRLGSFKKKNNRAELELEPSLEPLAQARLNKLFDWLGLELGIAKGTFRAEPSPRLARLGSSSS